MAEPPPPLALCYHGVARVSARDDPHRQFVSPEDLLSHIERLKRWGYRFVTFSKLARRVGEKDAKGLVALTFDDGLADNLTALEPLLEATGTVATVFVASDWLGGEHPASGRPMLSSDQLRSLAANGRFEIGGHTHTHPDLTKVSYESALEEFRTNKEALEEITGKLVTVAAYPYGYTNDDAKRACRAAGFEAACTTSGGNRWDDPFALPRQDMSSHQTSIGFWLKKNDLYERVVATLPGRAVRRLSRQVRAWRG